MSREDIIKKIEALENQLEADFAAKYPTIFKDLYRQVLEITAPVRFGGSADTRAKQLLEIIRLKKKIMATIGENEAYNEAIKDFTSGYKQLRDLTDEYFSLVVDKYTPKADLYDNLVKVSIEQTKDALLGAGVEAALAEPIVSSLLTSLSSKSNKVQFEALLQNLIEGTKTANPILQGEIGRLASDSMMIFQRSYLDAVSSDLNISYFLYSGTAIKTSRPFCKTRVGRIYKKSEIESWANQNWSGKMPNTTKQTIFNYAGGYRCRHKMWPASKEQYTMQQKRDGGKKV